MKIVFTELAVKELNETHSFYELEMEGLGEEFSKEMVRVTKRIAKFPEAYPITKNDIRKCVVRKFPYNLFYTIEKDFILILSIAHQHRRPFYWVNK